MIGPVRWLGRLGGYCGVAPVEYAPPLYLRALVVFSGRTGVRWLRWLKPGFRHCFVAIDDGIEWLTVDPLLHRLEIRASGLPSAFDLAAEYRRMGLGVVEVIPAPVALRRAPFGLFTCVEAAKRLLGIRARWILTPWQLYRRLARCDRQPAPSQTIRGAMFPTRTSSTRVAENKIGKSA